jgi:hypothetical protein
MEEEKEAWNQGVKMEKIFFQLPEGEWHSTKSESMWAEEISLKSATKLYKIDNIPFYTKSVSLGDLVNCVLNKEWGGLEFRAVVEHSGNSTYRIIAKPDRFLSQWGNLEEKGCSYESTKLNGDMLYAVNVPAAANIDEIYKILRDAEDGEVWIFEEGYFGHGSGKSVI